MGQIQTTLQSFENETDIEHNFHAIRVTEEEKECGV